ncbi:hypothetical protein [Chitinophaga sp. RAB17]|uniref:hypothetical protein n=1 Tax=Chitinophaga sp. RAB17 TaxID=3233049 RepID=UPI003F9176B9
MAADKYVLLVIEELKSARDNSQVEIIISVAIAGIEQTGYKGMIKPFVLGLQAWLENLSPINWNSTQWGCLRYANIYLRKYPMMELV